MTTPTRSFWHRSVQVATSPKPAVVSAALQPHTGLVSAMRPLALEQRFMFDGAGASDAAHAAADAAQPATHEQPASNNGESSQASGFQLFRATGLAIAPTVAPTEPTISGTSANQSVNDTTTLQPFSGVTLSGGNAILSITLDSSAKGSFTAASLTTSGFSTSDGGLTYTSNSYSAANLQTALRALVYLPTQNHISVGSTETTTFTLSMSDGINAVVTDNTTSVVTTSINDAPTLTGNLRISTMFEDASNSNGQSIIEIVGSAFSDPDTHASLAGLVVVGNSADSATEGVWQYSSNRINWYAIGTVTDTSGLCLSASTLLRFVPAADYNNGNIPSLNVLALDNTWAGSFSSGTSSQTRVTMGTHTNGGSTAISAGSTAISGTVTAVNDAPTLTMGTHVTVLEDAGAPTWTGWATGISAGPADESGQSLAFTVSNTNNALFSVQPSIDGSGNLRFTPAANAHGVATVTLALNDNGGSANGGRDTSAARTFTITVNPVNDAPTGIPTLSGNATEGQTLTASTANISDVDGLIGVTFNYQWQQSVDGSAWTNITGATAETFSLGRDQVGKQVRVIVSYTDNGGTVETLDSPISATVAGVVPTVTSIERASAQIVPSTATSIVYQVTFNVAVSGVDKTDFILTTTSGNASGSIASVSGSGTSWAVTVNSLAGDGTLRLDLKNSGTGIASASDTAISSGFTNGASYIVDRVAPVIVNLQGLNVPQRVGDTVTILLTVSNDAGVPYTLDLGSTVGGFSVSNLLPLSNTLYSAEYVVTDGGTDYAASASLPVDVRLMDAAGNIANWTTPITQSNDSINANPPSALVLSNASLQGASDPNALVGTLSTTDLSVGDSFTYTLISGAGSNDNALFSIVGNVLRVNDPASLAVGIYSVRIRTTDSGGNVWEKSFSITKTAYSAPVAVADSASANEAGGVMNATTGVNPTGNVLSNDGGSEVREVSGTVGLPLKGTYGTLTLNGDGSYSYVVDNSNAAVEALRTNADTLTETFTYTIVDTTQATSSAVLTITIHGANDAPQVNGTITARTVTEGTAWAYSVPSGLITDVDAGDTLTWSASLQGGAPLPAWMSFNPVTRTFSGTPGTAGDLNVTVTATDLSGASASITFTVRTTAATPPTPQEPTVPPVAATTWPQASIDMPSSAPSGAQTLLSAPTLPQAPAAFLSLDLGAASSAWTGGSFLTQHGSPWMDINERFESLGQVLGSSLSIERTASTGDGYPVVVLASEQPGLRAFHGAPNLQVADSQRLSFVVPADAFAHTDQNAVVVLRSALANGDPLPAWLHFDSKTARFEGTPPAGLRGELVIRIQARDAQGREAEVTFTIKVGSAERNASLQPIGRSGLTEQLRHAGQRTQAFSTRLYS